MQNVPNPVPRVEHPDWLLKRVAAASDKHRQQRLTSMFQPAKRGAEKGAGKQQGGGSDVDIEDMDMLANASAAAARQGAKRRKTATLYRVRLKASAHNGMWCLQQVPPPEWCI